MLRESELIVDSFAGGGGASTGIEMALGRSPDIAINHDAEALALHAANHPKTLHVSKNVWQVDPFEAVGRRPVGLLWASPDCKHFSKAKGGKPVKRNIRDLAWVVVMWAKRVQPRVIILENVEEFRGWGPLIRRDDGKMIPDPDRSGETFNHWVAQLRKLGYTVDWRELRASDYGAPTIRKRLFLIARRDGVPIQWPAPTHGAPSDPDVIAGLKKPWRTAAQIIDWSLPCPSIFLTREEGRAIGCNRPLADATMARIAKGVKRYVLDAAKPFIVPITHVGDTRTYDIDDPLRTITTAHRGEQALVSPVIVRTAHGDEDKNGKKRGRGDHDAVAPLPTVLGSPDFAVAAPFLVPRYGEREGQEPRTRDVQEPTATVVPTGNGDTLVAAHLTKFSENSVGTPPDEPLHTAMAGAPRHGLVAAFLAQHNTDMVGHHAEAPLSTIVQKGCTQAVVSAGLVNMKGSDQRGAAVEAPSPSICAQGTHIAEVRAFLMKYYGSDQAPELTEPLHTATTKARFGLVMVDGQPYEIADIGMRMLTPRELFRAQGFPDSYVIAPIVEGKALTKTSQIRMCGNSVCPPMAAALVRANFAEELKPPITPARPLCDVPLFDVEAA